ncbi:MAG TPA: hypothetical protein VJ810_02885 [Blastocatellia bacterium]|nr:hypothetical protein [Blastocatellia bacterium]
MAKAAQPELLPEADSCWINVLTNEACFMVKLLFPRYVFAQFKIDDIYHQIRFTRGVHTVMRNPG